MAEITTEEKRVWIPEIPDDKISELAQHIKPVIMFKQEGFCYIQPVDLFNVAYTWDAEPADEATGLVPLCDITTYHSYGHYSLFKPSIAEVIAQIPPEQLDKVVAFEIIRKPATADDLNEEQQALNAGYHVASTRLYARG